MHINLSIKRLNNLFKLKFVYIQNSKYLKDFIGFFNIIYNRHNNTYIAFKIYHIRK